MENKDELNIFLEAVKSGYKFSIALAVIISIAICSVVFVITSELGDEDITIQANQEDNTNTKQEVINGKAISQSKD